MMNDVRWISAHHSFYSERQQIVGLQYFFLF